MSLNNVVLGVVTKIRMIISYQKDVMIGCVTPVLVKFLI
tara:strand:- start:739 stop:855 length:117 start_codon:yes stop_codon:yes gene_type:complete